MSCSFEISMQKSIFVGRNTNYNFNVGLLDIKVICSVRGEGGGEGRNNFLSIFNLCPLKS